MWETTRFQGETPVVIVVVVELVNLLLRVGFGIGLVSIGQFRVLESLFSPYPPLSLGFGFRLFFHLTLALGKRIPVSCDDCTPCNRTAWRILTGKQFTEFR